MDRSNIDPAFCTGFLCLTDSSPFFVPREGRHEVKVLEYGSALRLELTEEEYRRLEQVRLMRRLIGKTLRGRRKVMPHMPAKPCAHPGCPGLTYDRYCETHEPVYPKRKRPDNRPSSAKRKYDRNWRAYRERFLQYHPLCVNFKACKNVATEVDHIIPEAQGGSFRDPTNHQAMCKFCHSRKTARENRGFGNPVHSSTGSREQKGRPREGKMWAT